MSGPHGEAPDGGAQEDEAPAPGDPEASLPGDVATADLRGPTFSLEGRAAPGLYFVGWLGTFIGVIALTIGIVGGVGPLFFAGLIVLAVGLLAASGAQALERARRPWLTYGGPSPWLVFAAVIPITLTVQLAAVAVIRSVSPVRSDPALALILLALTGVVYAAVVRFLIVGTGALSWRDMGLGIPRSRVVADLVYGAAFALPVLLVAGVLVQLLSGFLALPPSPLPDAFGAADVVANLISAAIIAPLGEELFFRGYATTAWDRTYGRRRAIVLGAVFFALAHVITIGGGSASTAIQAAIFAFAVRLPVGLVLGWLFLSRRSLAASIGLHATYNAIPVLLLAMNT